MNLTYVVSRFYLQHAHAEYQHSLLDALQHSGVFRILAWCVCVCCLCCCFDWRSFVSDYFCAFSQDGMVSVDSGLSALRVSCSRSFCVPARLVVCASLSRASPTLALIVCILSLSLYIFIPIFRAASLFLNRVYVQSHHSPH